MLLVLLDSKFKRRQTFPERDSSRLSWRCVEVLHLNKRVLLLLLLVVVVSMF